MNSQIVQIGCLTAFIACSIAPLAMAQNRDQVALQLEQQLLQYRLSGRYREAEQAGQQFLQFAIQAYGNESLMHAAAQSDLGAVYLDWRRYAEGEKACREAIRIVNRNGVNSHALLGDAYNNLGALYFFQHRYPESIQMHQRARAVREANNSPDVAMSLENIALSYDHMRQFEQAEPYYRQALRLHVAQHGREHEKVAVNLINQGLMYRRLLRLNEAEAYLQEALRMSSAIQNPEKLATCLVQLGEIFTLEGRYAEAEKLLQQAIENVTKVFGADSPVFASFAGDLGELYFAQGRYAEAEPIVLGSLEANEKIYGPNSFEVAGDLNQLGRLYMAQKRHAEAVAYFNRALDLFEKTGGVWAELGEVRFQRGIAEWHAGNHDKARDDFSESMQLADQGRAFITGAEHKKAESFSTLQQWYTLPGELYADAGKLNDAFNAFERGRARLLIEEMALAHVDLTAELPPAQRQRLKQALDTAQVELAQMEAALEAIPQRSDLSDEQQAQERERLMQQLDPARLRVVEAYTAIRAASPKLREVMGQKQQTPSLDDLEAWAKQQEAVVLYYAVTDYGSRVISLGKDLTPTSVNLSVSEEDAQVLGIKTGELRNKSIATALVNDSKTGVLELISRPKPDLSVIRKLAALWRILVPEPIRQAVLDGKVRRLVIIPDQDLALFPFESLVVDDAGGAKYLVDTDAAIDYAPSATILMQLSDRPAVKARGDREPVLAVGDPEYRQAANPASTAARYAGLGGELTRLPYSGREATWVSEVFIKQGIKAVILKEKLATEAMVRANVAGRQIVHLACHGLVDQSYGNFFGALALAPDGRLQTAPANDGFLSLTETYELDLRDCELTILSACETNYGPQQQGEGVFALTRGYLVAGSRRVVSSNWLVDDEAAASLISYFCGILAKQQQAGKTPDYAQALAEAKRWVRQQPKWHNPYYWATFVLIGPG